MTAPYKDELLYSVLARDYVRSGCINYSQYARRIYEEPIKKSANIEFLNPLKPDIKRQLEAYQPIEDYTMYGFYSMFMDDEIKGSALNMIRKAEGYYYKVFPIPAPKKRQKRHLRYCSRCAKEDREKYGETYWHQSHQMAGIDICYKHGCYLLDSTIEITGNKKEDFLPAELYAVKNEARFGKTDIDWMLARYTNRMRNNSQKLTSINFKGLLEGTKYITGTSRQMNKKKLLKDIVDYYDGVRMNSYLLMEYHQIDKILKGRLVQPVMICQILLYLKRTG